MLTPSYKVDRKRLRNGQNSGRSVIEEALPDNLVRLVYFDESGIHRAKDEPYETVAAVMVHGDDQMPAINADLRILRETLPSYLKKDFEFHAANMFKHFRKFGEASKYAEPMRAFLKIMQKHEVEIAAGMVYRPGFEEYSKFKGRSYDWAFMTAIERAATWMKERHSTEGALFISDDATRSQNDFARYVREFREGIPGDEEFSEAADYIVDTIFFGASHASNGIQMADFAGFFLKKHLMGDKLAAPFFQIIRSRYVHELEADWEVEAEATKKIK